MPTAAVQVLAASAPEDPAAVVSALHDIGTAAELSAYNDVTALATEKITTLSEGTAATPEERPDPPKPTPARRQQMPSELECAESRGLLKEVSRQI